MICLGTEAVNDPDAKSPVDSTFAETFGFTPESFSNMKRILAKSMYSQKHSDLVLSELVSQIEVACLEQGRLLRRVREQYAETFQDVSMLHSNSLWQLETAAQTISEVRSLFKGHRRPNPILVYIRTYARSPTK